MTESDRPPGRPGHGAAEAELQQLAQDWITLVQSELSALAADREAAESWQALLAIWAGAAGSLLRAAPRGADGHDIPGFETARPADAPRPAAAAAAFDPRDAEIDRLGDRIAELERRLSRMERGPGGADAPGGAGPAAGADGRADGGAGAG